MFGLLILRTTIGFQAFKGLGDQVSVFLEYTSAGASFVFGQNYTEHFFAFKVELIDNTFLFNCGCMWVFTNFSNRWESKKVAGGQNFVVTYFHFSVTLFQSSRGSNSLKPGEFPGPRPLVTAPLYRLWFKCFLGLKFFKPD